jgi:hypothetical protein
MQTANPMEGDVAVNGIHLNEEFVSILKIHNVYEE